MSSYGCYLGVPLTDEMHTKLQKKLIDEANAEIKVPEPTRGCSHKIKATDKFCSKCGRPAYVVEKPEEPWTEENLCIQEFDLPTVQYFTVSSYVGTQGIGYPVQEMSDCETLASFKFRLSLAIKAECGLDVPVDNLKFYVEGCSRCD